MHVALMHVKAKAHRLILSHGPRRLPVASHLPHPRLCTPASCCVLCMVPFVLLPQLPSDALRKSLFLPTTLATVTSLSRCMRQRLHSWLLLELLRRLLLLLLLRRQRLCLLLLLGRLLLSLFLLFLNLPHHVVPQVLDLCGGFPLDPWAFGQHLCAECCPEQTINIGEHA